ncbi:MAG TPA: hypothetical protein VM914_00705 [Pyrinomonadaceae bacterium]|jgi:hypothetical protein|nr:hypothetical protein [Pyrinomonadaceae bacterium]
MGFFSKLKKVVSGIDKGAAIAAAASGTIPGKAGQVTGQVAGEVTQGTGVVTAIVQQIQAKSGSEVPPEEAQKQATLATAVAVDDHEDRLKQLENMLKGLQTVAGAVQGSQAGQGTQAGGGSAAGQGTQAGGGSQAGQGKKA